jgi:hypothetical protein
LLFGLVAETANPAASAIAAAHPVIIVTPLATASAIAGSVDKAATCCCHKSR